uniref:helix-turn-helix domain-containing protein n=1 Tax=Neobacillus sp. FSL H8-0543 TaxID=2954672 RepID=UPI00406C3FCA
MEKWKGKSVRLSTLEAFGKAIDFQPGDILKYKGDEEKILDNNFFNYWEAGK